MRLKTLFRRAVEIGIAADPRGKASIVKSLKQETDRQKKLEEKEKPYADEERTWNPYSDSRIVWGTGEEEIRCVLVGIDVETQELILADRMRAHGTKIDAVMTHHPEGRALADLDKVMPVQVDVMVGVGVPVNHAEAFLKPRMDRIWRAIHADNLFRSQRTAELLALPFFGCHTITDNLAWQFMEKHICKRSFDTLEEVLNAIRAIPEHTEYARRGNPPILVNGASSGRPGRVAATEFTGGTNGPEEFLEAQSKAGVGTILTMHVTEKELDKAKEHHVNIVQCSHMASDSLGINLLYDALTKEDKKLEVIPFSGFVRIAR